MMSDVDDRWMYEGFIYVDIYLPPAYCLCYLPLHFALHLCNLDVNPPTAVDDCRSGFERTLMRAYVYSVPVISEAIFALLEDGLEAYLWIFWPALD